MDWVFMHMGFDFYIFYNLYFPYKLCTCFCRLNQWYTSGLQRKGYRQWAGDGDSLTGVATNWVIDPTTEAQVAQTFSEAHLVYQYSGI